MYTPESLKVYRSLKLYDYNTIVLWCGHLCVMAYRYLNLWNMKWNGLEQGRTEPPKAARGHATYKDGKMLSVTKYRIQIWTV